jgi:hypothetical protein
MFVAKIRPLRPGLLLFRTSNIKTKFNIIVFMV